MYRESGVPRWLAVALVAVVLVVAALAYSAGRLRRSADGPGSAEVELPAPGPPSPDVSEPVLTPGETPPTVTPAAAVLLEKESRSSRRLVERSSEVVVPVSSPGRIPSPLPTVFFERAATPRSREPIAARPSPTPTVPELGEAPTLPTPAAPEPSVPNPPPTPVSPGYPPPPQTTPGA